MERKNENQIAYFKAWLESRRYSNSTIKTYTEALMVFLNHYPDKHPSEISNSDVVLFNRNYITTVPLKIIIREEVRKIINWDRK